MLVSIFNDVIGPVMRGPSSSHCVAALRIGRLARDLMEGEIAGVRIEFDRQGALPTTHESQGSDMGLFGGLLGWEATDERLPQAAEVLRKSGTQVQIAIVDGGDPHPSTYRLTLRNGREEHFVRAISTGGGMVEVIEIDGFKVSIGGDYYETLVWVNDPGVELVKHLQGFSEANEVILHESGGRQLVEVKSGQWVSEQSIGLLKGFGIKQVKRLAPVLPVLSRKGMRVPFTSCEEMLTFDGGRNRPLWQLAVQYEMARGNLTEAQVMGKMVEIVRVLRRSIEQGIGGTRYKDRILGAQSGVFQKVMQAEGLLKGGALNRVILYVTALMEVKSSMGVIVAAPTAGACAALPGAVIAVSEELGLGEEEMAKALLAGGVIGVFIATGWTFAAEVGGCQAEGGAASSMAAAGLVTLVNGTLAQAVGAASMALQNVMGLICDPVAGRVEVPCLGKNVMAASNAFSCANMALANFDAVISLDETIEAARRVGNQLPRELRCTALGGLSITKSSLALQQRLTGR